MVPRSIKKVFHLEFYPYYVTCDYFGPIKLKYSQKETMKHQSVELSLFRTCQKLLRQEHQQEQILHRHTCTQLSNLSLDMNNLNNLLWFSLIFTFFIFFYSREPNLMFHFVNSSSSLVRSLLKQFDRKTL